METDRARLLYELGCAFAARIELDELLPLGARRVPRRRSTPRAPPCCCSIAARNELYFPYVAQDDAHAAAELRTLRFPADRGIAGADAAGRPIAARRRRGIGSALLHRRRPPHRADDTRPAVGAAEPAAAGHRSA